MVDKLALDFKIINTFRTICSQLPPISYVDHVDLKVFTKKNGEFGAAICGPVEENREVWKNKVQIASINKFERF